MKKVISAVLVFILLICLTSCGGKIINPLSKKAEEEYKTALIEISGILRNDTIEDMDECMALYIQVWHNSIAQQRDERTDRYTMENGMFLEDFNDAVRKLFNDKEFSDKISEIRKTRFSLMQLRKTLEKSPYYAKNVNECMLNATDAIIEYSEILLNPSGSYNEVTAERAEIIGRLKDSMDGLAACQDELNKLFGEESEK